MLRPAGRPLADGVADGSGKERLRFARAQMVQEERQEGGCVENVPGKFQRLSIPLVQAAMESMYSDWHHWKFSQSVELIEVE